MAAIVQSQTTASTTAAPSSLSAACASTSVGTLLVALIATANSSSGASVTKPAGWSILQAANQGASIGFAVMALPNNPGGLTSIAFPCANVNAIAVTLYEISGMPAASVVQDPANQQAAITSNASSATLAGPAYQPALGNCVYLALLAALTGNTLTNTSIPAALWIAGGTGTTTTGATNVQTKAFAALPGPVFPPASGMQASLTNGAAVACGICFVALASLASGALSQAGDGNGIGASLNGAMVGV